METLPSCFDLVRAFRPGLNVEGIAAWVESDGAGWERRTIKLFGKESPIPRLTKWYGEPYTYSGIEHTPEVMPGWLQRLRVDVERACSDRGGNVARFNSALLNYYRDGRDSVSWHADDEPELGQEPTIASLSIGAPRTFAIRALPTRAMWRTALGDGDLLIMRGESQSIYQHSVPKAAAAGPRINITFRWIGPR